MNRRQRDVCDEKHLNFDGPLQKFVFFKEDPFQIIEYCDQMISSEILIWNPDRLA